MRSSTAAIAVVVAVLSSCGREAPPVVENRASPSPDTEGECPDPGTDTDADSDSDVDSDTDTDSDSDADAGPDTDTNEMEGNCPWFCADFVGEYSCSSTLNPPTAVYNPNFECATDDRICCQPLGAPGGLDEYCGDQAGFSCEIDCTGEWQLPTTEYFCNAATATCCENTKPTCVEIDGMCVNIWDSCPGDYSAADFSCGLLETCCAPPECPWTCAVFDDEYTCSESLDPPTAIHNYEWSCLDPDEICCQPLGAPDGITGACGDQEAMACRESCLSYETQRTGFYCGPATQVCCEDLREPCGDIGGTCEILWMCPEGTEVNQGGICDALSEVCCTAIDPANTCELGGGACVEWGVSCPLLMIPAPTVSCGTWTQMCCQWSWS